MEATLKFSLDEERWDFDAALEGPSLFLALSDILKYLRGQEKYVEPDQRDDIPAVREKIREILSARGLDHYEELW